MDDIHLREMLQQQNRALLALQKHFVPEAQEERERRWRIFLTKLVAITGIAVSGIFGGWEFFKYLEDRYKMRAMANCYAEVASEIYFQENNAEVAQLFLGKAIELEDNDTRYRYLQAYIDGMAAVRTLMNLDRPFTKEEMDLAHKAIAHAILLERLSPDRPEPFILKGQVYSALGQNDRALKELQAAISLAPANDFAHVRLATVLAEQDKVDEALREIDASISLNPQSKWAWLWKGVIHADRQSDWARAREAYSKALELDPRFDLAYYNLAWTYLKQEPRDYIQARDLFEKALGCNPNYKQAYYGLGMVYGYQDQYEPAKVYLDKAISLDKTFLTALKWRAIVLDEMGSYPEALLDFSKAIELAPADPELYVRRARVYEKTEKLDKATSDLRFAAELDSKDKRTWLYLGDVFLKVGEYDKALEYYGHAIELDPAYSEAQVQAAQAYVKKGNAAKARESLDAAVQNATYRPERFLVARGLFLKGAGQFDEALTDFRKAREAASDDLNAWLEEARLLLKLGRKQEALDAVNGAIALKPQEKKLHELRDEIKTLP